jgi:AraC-like DNA-binding protein
LSDNTILFELNFPKLDAQAAFRPLSVPDVSFGLSSLSKNVRRIVTGSIKIPQNVWGLVFNWEGTTVFRVPEEEETFVVPGNSVFFTRSDKLIARVATGTHQSTVITWHSDQLPLMKKWFERSERCFAVQSISVGHESAAEEIKNILNERREVNDLLLTGAMYRTVGTLMASDNALVIADHRKDLPDNVLGLIKRVRENPAGYWPLPEAARATGYSVQHFSRYFKSVVGYGFQSFVERCRTEIAIDQLRTTRDSVDSIAENCGFGAPQAMRNALREYIGLVPSDLRIPRS